MKILLTGFNSRAVLVRLILIATILPLSLFSFSETKHEFIDWELPVKTFAEIGVPPEQVAAIIGDGQFVINSKPQNYTSWNARKKIQQEYKGQRVLSVASVVHAPADKIRSLVWDMASQDDFSPLLKKSENLTTHENSRIAKYTQVIKVPILELKSTFVWQMDKKDNGDISQVLIGKGDVQSTFQYWEFLPLGENKTLLVLTGWQDMDSASLMFKIILDAEPAISKIFPLLSYYERARQFKTEAEKRWAPAQQPPSQKTYNIKTVNKFLSDNKAIDLKELKKLNEYGGLMLVHENRKLNHEGETLDIIQVSGIQYLPFPEEKIKPYLSDLSNLPEYNEIVDWYKAANETKDGWAHMKIKVKIGPFSVPVHAYPLVEEYAQSKYVVSMSPEAYMYPMHGHIEHLDMPEGDNGTMYELGFGGVIGPEASWIFKMARYLPYHNVLIAAAFAMLSTDNLEPWATQKMAEEGAS